MAGRGKNRRKQDVAERKRSLREDATRLGKVVVRLVLAVGISAGLYFGVTRGYVWATTSPSFALKDVTFHGNERATEADLLRLSGLAFGQNLVRMDIPSLERAMDGHPWVRHARVTRHFPSSISVEIDEHEAAAIVSLGELYLMDAQGTPFKKLQSGDVLDLPLITGMGREEYVASPEGAAKKFRNALELVAAWSAAEKPGFGSVSEIHVESEGMTVVTSKGVEVHMGLDATDEKLARLDKVRGELSKRGLEAEVIRLDNRVRPGWVTVKTPTPLSERKRGTAQ